MTRDWHAVAEAISARLTDLDMTQAELAARAGVALETVRELQHNLRVRRRSPRTLAALSQALAWPDEYLANLADQTDTDARPTSIEQVLAELGDVRTALAAITARLEGIERRLPDGSGSR